MLFNDPLFNSVSYKQKRVAPDGLSEVRVIGRQHWGAHVSAVKMGPEVVGCVSPNCAAIVDSGTSVLILPQFVIDRLTVLLQQYDVEADCSGAERMPALNFTVVGADGAVEISLPPSAYLVRLVGEAGLDPLGMLANLVGERIVAATHIDKCQPLLMSMDVESEFGPMIVLGHPIFSEYIVSFNPSYPWGMYLQKSQRSVDCLARHPAQSVLEGGSKARFRTVAPDSFQFPSWLSKRVEL